MHVVVVGGGSARTLQLSARFCLSQFYPVFPTRSQWPRGASLGNMQKIGTIIFMTKGSDWLGVTKMRLNKGRQPATRTWYMLRNKC